MRRPTLPPQRLRPLATIGALVAGLLVVPNLVAPPAGSAVALAGPPATDATIDAWFDAQRADSGIPGGALVVVRDGHVHAAGFGTADASGRPVTTTTPFVLGSVSKAITALAVVQLAQRGRIDLDAPLRRYLPEFRLADPAAADAITVRQLLTQTSGIPTSAGLVPLQEPVGTLDARVRELATVRPSSAPGAAYQYSNANYVVLGRLLEVVSGAPLETDLRQQVFDPLGMAHATTERAIAVRDGLGDAHRLVFGVADTHAPLDRPDLAPAGFISASADDMGRYLGALLDPGGPGGGSVASAATVRTLFAGTAPTGLPGERYAMGWVDTTFRGQRVVAHAGSTTDMAAFVAVMPERGVAVAILLDAQSPLYELLHKPDAIGLGVLALAIGEQPAGTLEHFYPAFDLAVALLVLVLARGLARVARRAPGPDLRPRWQRWPAIGLRAYLDGVVPAAILLGAPAWLGAWWPALLHTDIGIVLAAVAMVRLADGALRLRRWRAAAARPAAPSLVATPAAR